MTANVYSPIGAPRAEVSESREAARERDRSEEVWAFAIAEVLAAQVPRLRSALPASAGSATDNGAAERTAEHPPEAGSTASSTGEAGLDGTGDAPPTEASQLPVRLTTELSDGRLGRLELTVARGAHGLAIVINVADSHVKALIEAEQATLLQSLKDCGLSIASVRIGQSSGAGIALAPDREGADRARSNTSLRQHNQRLRAYQGSLDEEDDAPPERVDLTA
jgi:hypothetical protein